MILLELFKKVADWKWSNRTSLYKTVVFSINDMNYKVNIMSPEGNGIWDVEFEFVTDVKSYKASYGLNGMGNSTLVMSTVTDILKNFYQSYSKDIEAFTFSAEEESRKTLYSRMFKRFLPDWKISLNPDNGMDAYIVTKPK